MKAKELIKKLQELDPDDSVYCRDGEGREWLINNAIPIRERDALGLDTFIVLF